LLLHCFKHVQVTRQLSALCIQAHQHQAAMGIRQFATASLGLWLYKTTGALNASPASRLAVGVRQQLQASGLLQHMAAMLTDAGDGLTAAAAAAVAFGEPARGSSSSESSSTTGSSTAAQDSADRLRDAWGLVDKLHDLYCRLCEAMSPEADITFNLEAALPAAPAAVRLIVTAFRTCSRLQQLAGMEGSSATVQLVAADAAFQDAFAATLGSAFLTMLDLAQTICVRSSEGTLQSLPDINELLRCAELVPCLAITVLVAVLGVDTGAHGGAGSSAVASWAPASSSGGGSIGAGSSSGVQALASQGTLQQQSVSAAAVSAGLPHQSGRSSSSGSTSSCGRLENGVNLGSLTPLSHALFNLLGVEQGVLLSTSAAAKTNHLATWGANNNSITTFDTVMAHQVSCGMNVLVVLLEFGWWPV
jgi:hypothetical protein